MSIGIDLGTTYSCVGTWQDGGVKLIPNEDGRLTTPSVVYIDNQPIYDVKRLIGRSFNDDAVQLDRRNWSFEVIDCNGRPYVKVGDTTYPPEQLSALTLTRLKKNAENYLGVPVTRAVITVPAYFTDNMRNCTKDAAEIAGLEVLRLINEPTAASLAYGLDKGDTERKIIVFDCGGGTHDVSLLSIEAGIFEVLSTAGDTHLGGEDFNARLMQYVREKVSIKDIDALRLACETAKRTLSEKDDTIIKVEGHQVPITRVLFEKLCDDLFERTIQPVDYLLNDAKCSPTQIDDVVLVGGSTSMPRIREMITKKFGKEPNIEINPDTAVAYGAAVQAGILTGVVDKDLLLIDILPISLSLETAGGVATRIVSRNSSIPRTQDYTFYTNEDNQTIASVKVFEGERPMTRDNKLLGSFDLCGIPPRPRGHVKVQVTYNVDCDGLLTVTAKELLNGNRIKVDICNYRERVDRSTLRNMIEDAEENWEQDKQTRLRNNTRIHVLNTCYGMQNSFDDNEEKIRFVSEERKAICLAKAKDVVKWFDDNPDACLQDCKEQECELKDVIDLVFGWKDKK